MKRYWLGLLVWVSGFFVFDLLEAAHFWSLHNVGQSVFFAVCAGIQCVVVGFVGGMLAREIQ